MKRPDLKKLPMPAKPLGASEAHDDLESMLADEANETPEDEANESPEYQKKEEEMGVEAHNPELADVSDDDLIEEMKRRGLIAGDDEGAEAAPDDEEAEGEAPVVPAPKKK